MNAGNVPSRRRLERAAISILVLVGCSIFPIAYAAEEAVRALQLPDLAVEREPSPWAGIDLPPRAYPLEPVDQLPFRGARHGFVSTTAGNLAFRVRDLRLPGRMPIELGRVYDSAIADALASFSVPPAEPPWNADLGKNWILSYQPFLLATVEGYLMVTSEGDLVAWVADSGGAFHQQMGSPSRHTQIQRTSPTVIVETQLDGTKWTYAPSTLDSSMYVLTQVADGSGNTITLTYNLGHLARIQNSDGAWVELLRPEFDSQYPTVAFPSSRVVRLTDSTGRMVYFDYDSLGLLTSVTDALGKTWTYAYGSNEKLVSATDPLDNEFLTASYDTNGRVQSFEADNGPWTFDYSHGTDTTSATDGLGHAWDYVRDVDTGVTTEIDEPTGGVHELVFDSLNNPTQYLGPGGANQVRTYDGSHRPLTWRPSAPGTGSFALAYDGNGRVSSITAPDGGVTTFTRDTAGRVTQESNALGNAWTASYAANGDRLTLRQPRGNAQGGQGYLWQFAYDGFGNATSVTDPTTRVFQRAYTTRGELWKERRPDHYNPSTGQIVYAEWVHGYDLLGRRTSSTDPLGNAWTWTYDDAGRLVRAHGPAGTTLRYGYDAHSRLSFIVQGDDVNEDPKTSFGHDAAGRMTTKTLSSGSVWTYAYDASARFTGVTDPLNRTWTYGRDAAGKIASITHPGGQVVTYVRDDDGRLISREFPGGRVETFEYDTIGRLSSAEVAEGSQWNERIEWTRDLLGRPTSLATTYDVPPNYVRQTLQFSYDADGNRSSLVRRRTPSDPPLDTTTYTYDGVDRLLSTTSTSGDYWQATYDDLSGNRTRVESWSNGEVWTYDAAGRRTGYQQWIYDQDWNPLTTLDVAWTLDAEGRLLSETDNLTGVSHQIAYGPDGLPSEVQELGVWPPSTTAYSYDGFGHMLQSVTRVGPRPPVTTTFQWDTSGRLVLANRGTLTRTYTWNDSPDDPASAMRITRGPSDFSERAAEIDFGFDGRVRRIRAYDATWHDPRLVSQVIWGPFEKDLALEAREAQSNWSIETRQMGLEVGGYYAEEAGGSIQRWINPVVGIDNAAAMLRVRPLAGAATPELPLVSR